MKNRRSTTVATNFQSLRAVFCVTTSFTFESICCNNRQTSKPEWQTRILFTVYYNVLRCYSFNFSIHGICSWTIEAFLGGPVSNKITRDRTTIIPKYLSRLPTAVTYQQGCIWRWGGVRGVDLPQEVADPPESSAEPLWGVDTNPPKPLPPRFHFLAKPVYLCTTIRRLRFYRHRRDLIQQAIPQYQFGNLHARYSR